MNTLYLECKSGISGDMTVGALLDLGADEAKLINALDSLKLEGVKYKISKVKKNGISATDFNVILPKHNHHDKHHHTHEHRNLFDVYSVIDKGDLTDNARGLAKKIFKIVAEAEAKVHGEDIKNVHFHEVGALDSIVDIVATAVCIDDLNIEKTAVTPLHEGSGFVKCQHGMLPVPVPAVAQIAQTHSIPLKITQTQGEMVTPTGIAIVAALCNYQLPETFTVEKTGYGAGKKDFEHPNLLRAMLIITNSNTHCDNIWMLETNLDDCTGEQIGLAMETLMEKGAKDVHCIPIFMKKNRPGWLLRIIADFADIPVLEKVLFLSTTTIGIRKTPYSRTCLKREIIDVTLPFGVVKIKKCTYGENKFYYPEYESVKEISSKNNLDFMVVFNEAKKTTKEGGY